MPKRIYQDDMVHYMKQYYGHEQDWRIIINRDLVLIVMSLYASEAGTMFQKEYEEFQDPDTLLEYCIEKQGIIVVAQKFLGHIIINIRLEAP